MDLTDDDQLAEAIADRIVELAQRPGLVRLAAMQMSGLIPDHGLADGDLASLIGCTRKTIINTRRNGIQKLKANPALHQLAMEALRTNRPQL